MPKYFLDTNILLDIPKDLDLSKCIISSKSIEELENIKTSRNKDDEIKLKARHAVRNIIKYKPTVFLINKNTYEILETNNILIDNDMLILASAKEYNNEHKIIFLTSDYLAYLRAKHEVGIECELVGTNKSTDVYKGYKRIKGDTAYINNYMSNINFNEWVTNEYIIIENTDDGKKSEMRYDGNTFVNLKLPPSSFIKGKNSLQRCALDLMLNPEITTVAVLGTYGSGKAMPDNTLIPVPYGYKRLDELSIGDVIFDRKGQETKITGIYPQGVLDNYKVTFSDNRIAYCNDEHIWSCITSKGNLVQKTVREMMDTGLKTTCGINRYKIPTNSAIEYKEAELPVDPYVLGSFLGNGCCTEKPLTFSSNDTESVEIISKLIGAKEYAKLSEFSYSWIFYLKNQIGSTTRYQTKDFFKDVDGVMCFSYEKFIDNRYKYGSIKQRLALLQGLLDTDGTVDNKGRIRYSSSSYQLIKDIQEICWSLGFITGKISVDNYERKCRKSIHKTNYNINILCTPNEKLQLFRTKRKYDIVSKYVKKTHSNTYCKKNKSLSIVDIEFVGKETMRCIQVDNQEHLYLANDFLVTHNTYLAMQMAMYHTMEKSNQEKILGVREAMGSGKDVGYLKGSFEDKTKLFFLPLEQQLGHKAYDYLLMSGKIQTNIPFYMKGTTYNDTVLVVDEAEDLNKAQIKLIGTRLGKNSRIYFSGDYKQSEVDKTSNNGLVQLCNELKGNKKFGCIVLDDDVRSETSKIFADLFEN